MLPSLLILLGLTLLGEDLALLGDDLARTTRIVRPEVRQAFYRSGGRLLVGRKVHLHLEASVLRRTPTVLPTAGESVYLVFENRSVPVIIHSGSPYWRQVQRHLVRTKEFCLKGVLKIPEHDKRRRVHLVVTKIVRAPGGWS